MVAGDTVYVLDSDVFIGAARSYYAFDISPRFWNCLTQLAEDGRIASIDRVKQELDRGNDDLREWANTRFSQAFKSCDDDSVIAAFSETMKWVGSHKKFEDAAKSVYASKADGWLVAYAKAKGFIVVTQEIFSPEARNRIPIPNICEAFSVRYVNTFQMLRDLGVKFI
ncbi:MAG TPA: DUF4411 family protein [bacterium]|nr:DUF4411 family protein [bacterium]